jgi:DNA-binding transcriptional LysR family regulator
MQQHGPRARKQQAMLFDTVLLRTFAAICDFGSFTKAAREVNLTQSAVSLHIKRLEDQVGSQLIERNTHGIWLTERGEVFLSYARRILALNKEAAHRLRNDRASVIRIGAPEYFDLHALLAVLGQFASRYPASQHHLELGLCPHISALLNMGELDIAIVSSEIGEGDGVSLRRERRIWAAGGTMQLDPEKPVPLALYRGKCSWRQLILDQLDMACRTWTVVLQSTGTAGIVAALNSGLAITVLPEYGLPNTLRALGSSEALPPLPDFEYVLRQRRGCRAAEPLADMFVSFFHHLDDREIRSGDFRCSTSDTRTRVSESLRLSCGSAQVTPQPQTRLRQ